jgi:hypothetical protein
VSVLNHVSQTIHSPRISITCPLAQINEHNQRMSRCRELNAGRNRGHLMFDNVQQLDRRYVQPPKQGPTCDKLGCFASMLLPFLANASRCSWHPFVFQKPAGSISFHMYDLSALPQNALMLFEKNCCMVYTSTPLHGPTSPTNTNSM